MVGRLFQGLGGGSMIAIAYVGIASLFPSRLYAPPVGFDFGGVGQFGLAGPTIGGWFAERLARRLGLAGQAGV